MSGDVSWLAPALPVKESKTSTEGTQPNEENMKNLTVIVGLLMSLQSFGASHDYERMSANPDGSFSINRPKFGVPTGGKTLINSEDSDQTGVCVLYGFKRSVAVMGRSVYSGLLAVIGADGKISALIDRGYGQTAYDTMVCTSDGTIFASTQYGSKRMNDDGSYTILSPRFDFDGHRLISSSRSDLTGVCKLFGYSKYLAVSVSSVESAGVVAYVGSDGKLAGFSNDGYGQYVINSLICTD